MKLFLDDTREFPSTGFECCRDAETAILFLSIMPFDFITLDYSLGAEKNGLDVLTWMFEHNINVQHINVHSNHIIGRQLMKEYAKEHFPNSIITDNMLPK